MPEVEGWATLRAIREAGCARYVYTHTDSSGTTCNVLSRLVKAHASYNEQAAS